MTESLARDDLLTLLRGLGSEKDEDALSAARQLHERVTAAGLAWEDLLADEAADHGEADGLDAEIQDETSPAADPGQNKATLALIEELLRRPGNSEDFIEELRGYKADIAAGEFEARDHRYVHALHKRLSTSG